MKWISRWVSLLLITIPVVICLLIPLRPESKLASAAEKRAQSSIEQEQYPYAAADLNQVLLISPWRYDLWEKLGHVQYLQKKYDRAITAFQNARRGEEISFESIVELGNAYIAMNRQGDAQDLWRSLSEKSGDDPEYMMKVAQNQRKIGDTFGTIATLLQIYRITPQDAGLNYLIGIHLVVTQPESSIKFLKVAASSDLYQKKTSQELLALLESKEGSEALRYLQIGQVLSNANEWDMAAAAFDSAVRLDNQNAFSWALLGEALQHIGKDGHAELNKALELDPTQDMANALMALYYRRHNQPDKALVYLRIASDANPTNGVWLAEIGNTLADMGDLNSALDAYIKGTEVAPEDAVVWQALATFSLSHNLDVETTGISAARKALSLDPGNPLLLDLMGTAFLINGDLDSAERFLLQAVGADENEASIHYHLGQLYIQKKDCSRAVVEFNKTQELTTEDRILSNVQRLVREYCMGY